MPCSLALWRPGHSRPGMARIVVTGGNGFLGRHLALRLTAAGHDVVSTRSAETDLRDPRAAREAVRGADGVYHLAAVVGGIAYNVAHPATLVHDNTVMGLNVLEATRQEEPDWVVLVGSACEYPGDTPVPTPESALWEGAPEASNAPYGAAKRVVAMAGSAYATQYGLDVVNVIPANLYGPGDHFDPETAHVLPSLMTRFHRAKREGAPEVVCWGDGTPTRDLLYVEDCADLLVRAPDAVPDAAPVNLGTSVERTIRSIAEGVADTVGYEGKLVWDASKPRGQSRRALALDRMRAVFGDTAFTDFEEGLRRTYDQFLTTPWAQK